LYQNDPREAFTPMECYNRWKKAMSDALELDIAVAKAKNKERFRFKVLKTWSGTLKNEIELPRDWTDRRGVLVGMRVELNFPSL
jgi:hypothetical protein